MFTARRQHAHWLTIASILTVANLPGVSLVATAQDSSPGSRQFRDENRVSPHNLTPLQQLRSAIGTRGPKGRGPIQEIDVDITPGPGSVPANVKISQSPNLTPNPLAARRNIDAPVRFFWKSPGLYHYRLYFADEALERHGHSRSLPAVHSGIHFFSQLAVLPLNLASPLLVSPTRSHSRHHSASRQR